MAEHVLTLGEWYRDKISGYEGAAVVRYTRLNGTTEIALCANVDKDGKIPKHEYIDSGQLVTMNGEPITLPPLPETTIVLGRSYRDSLSGLVGVACSRADHLNGCVQYAIEPGVDKEGKMQSGYMIDDARLEDVATGAPAQKHPAPVGYADVVESR